MFVDGLTRKVSVPLLWWRPVVWASVGMIAYEFEEGVRTLLEYVGESGLEKAVRSLKAPLSQLYEGGDVGSAIPRRLLKPLLGDLPTLTSSRIGSGIVTAISSGDRLDTIDNSVRVKFGPQHGDLHGRNILIGDRHTFLIDFAHYVEARERGVPLLDFAKLCVDLWAFTDALGIAEVLEGRVLRRHVLSQIGRLALIGGEPTEDEDRLFKAAVSCFLTKYEGYHDVPGKKREEAFHMLAEGN
jgi:hypothetical protein